jgi:hypothetical protein
LPFEEEYLATGMYDDGVGVRDVTVVEPQAIALAIYTLSSAILCRRPLQPSAFSLRSVPEASFNINHPIHTQPLL